VTFEKPLILISRWNGQ